SPLAEIVPTCAIASPLMGFAISWIDCVTTATALSMPRLRPIGFAPAATIRTPSLRIAWARTVAVVVPSPATSEVLEATSRTIWAPMFSSASSSSISLATVTPSLVIVGLPNFFSMTTLRPFGPSVTFTASARMLTPRRIACREPSPWIICLAIAVLSPVVLVGRPGLLALRGRLAGALDDAEDLVLAHDEQLLAVELHFGAGVLAEQDAVAFLHVRIDACAV